MTEHKAHDTITGVADSLGCTCCPADLHEAADYMYDRIIELTGALEAVALAGTPDIHGFTTDMHHAEQAARLVRKVLKL